MGSIRSCMNCKERYLGCHDVCEKYQEDKEALDAENRAKRKAKNPEFEDYWNAKKFQRRR